MAIQWGGVAGMVFFYLVILAVGIWASRKTKGAHDTERAMVADRNFGWGVGLFSLIATWVGGGYINGTAEVVFTPGWGLVWAQAPWGYSISFIIRSTISVILELDKNLSVIISACIAAFYTLFGGLYSVAYTDIVQLACIFVGFWICLPFALTNDAVTPIVETTDRWLGEWDTKLTGIWIDNCLLVIFGGVPYQAYYQRALSVQSPDHARYISIVAAFGCAIITIPAYILGAVGASTNWTLTDINLNKTDPYETPGIVLPDVIQFLTPPFIAFLGLGPSQQQ
eukprot:XP_011674193.1 PREDICTED: high-affinity choline transporter 1-like [Strongylocentrotus purpuratus]